MFSVKKCYLFEGVSPSFSIIAEYLKGPQNVHGVSKIDFLRIHQRKRTKRKGALSLDPSDCPALLKRAGHSKTPPVLVSGSDSLRA